MQDNFDFFKYAGIHRSVVLYTTPKNFIDDITVSTEVSGTTGTVSYAVDAIQEGSSGIVSVALRDKDNVIVAEATGESGTLTVPNANLWWPYTMVHNVTSAGYQYTLEVC